jgi:dUTP pyrophosphatase
MLTVMVRRRDHGRDLPLPAYATADSAGCDLCAAVAEPVLLPPLGRAVIPCGIAIALPPGYEAQIRPRSGLAARHGITVLNSPGTIDADYRGEIGAILINFSHQPFRIERGMRIAQLIVSPVRQVAWADTSDLPASSRGGGGFGSTGLNPETALSDDAAST